MLEKEGYEVMGAAFEVYNTLGCGFLEEVYQQAMEIECEGRGIPSFHNTNLSCDTRKDR